MKLSINGLSFSYIDKKIFEGLSLNLLSKNISVLIGRNGAGKSTLLRIIAGLEEQDKGELNLRDNSNDKVPFRGNISYLGHKLALKEELSVQENITFWERFYNCRLPYDDYKNLGMEDLGLQKVEDLSQGQKKKVALFRIIMANKKIWLLDEPLSNLDEHTTDYFKNYLLSKIHDNKLIIVTSHARLNMKKESAIYIGEKL